MKSRSIAGSLAMAASLVVTLPLMAAGEGKRVITVPYVEGSGFDYGAGYDTKTNTVLLPCVSGNRPSMQYSGQKVSSSLQLIDEAMDFSDKLRISTSESVKGGVVSESMHAEMMNELKISEHSVTYVANVDITGPDLLLDTPALTYDAKDMLATKKDDFQKKCGDYFVYGFTTGGQYLGTINIETSSLEDKNEVKLAFSQSGAFGAESSSTEFTNSMSLAISKHKVDVNEYRVGGTGAIDADDIQTLRQNYQQFAQQVMNAPVKKTVQLMSYGVLPGVDLEASDLSALEDNLSLLGVSKIDLSSVLNDIDYTLSNPTQFPTADASTLGGMRAAVLADIKTIKDAATKCGDSPHHCSDHATAMAGKAEVYRKQLPPQGGLWTKMAGTVRQVSVATKDLIWGISQKGINGGYTPVQWDGTDWQNKPGGLTTLSIGTDGTVWGINDRAWVYRWNGSDWTGTGSIYLDRISVGDANWIWGSNTDGLWRWNANRGDWDRATPAVYPAAVFSKAPIAASGDQSVFTIVVPDASSQGLVMWRTMNNDFAIWAQTKVNAISAGTQNLVWALDVQGRPMRWDPAQKNWTIVPGPLGSQGGFTSISAGKDGTVVGVNAIGDAFMYRGGS